MLNASLKEPVIRLVIIPICSKLFNLKVKENFNAQEKIIVFGIINQISTI